MALTSTATLRSGWGFWAGWGAAFVGFPLGGLAAQALIGGITTPAAGALGGAATGAVIGATQWLVLRRRATVSPWWIAATAIGMAGGLAFGIALFGSDTTGVRLPLRALVTGTGIGLAQYAMLRGITNRAAIWPPVVALAWALGWIITRAVGVDLTYHWSVFGSAGALVFQLLTGLALAYAGSDRVTG